MVIDKKSIMVAAQAGAILVLVILLIRTRTVAVEEKDEYVQQLLQQNKDLQNNIDRLKRNYIEIGLADSIQTKNMDSLIAISGHRLEDLHKQISDSRMALEEMKKMKWEKLSEKQIDSEIQEAISYLKSNEKTN
jgi:hypothetical protein